MNLYIYEYTTSTNDLGRRRLFKEGDVIWAHSQSAGRGQRGNRWQGERESGGENIAFSIILEPTWLPSADGYFISQMIALALVRTLASYGIEARIKWTNDIYIGDFKVAGVLIENSFCDGVVARSVVGIGLNVNQLAFSIDLPNPISMAMVADRSFGREEVLRRVYSNFMTLYSERNSEVVGEEYNQRLYRLNEVFTYRLADGSLIKAAVIGVAPRGELHLKHEDGVVRSYLFKEVEFVV